MWWCGGDRSFQYWLKKAYVELIYSNNAMLTMPPSFGISSSRATVKEGEEKEKEEFDPAFFFIELRDYFH